MSASRMRSTVSSAITRLLTRLHRLLLRRRNDPLDLLLHPFMNLLDLLPLLLRRKRRVRAHRFNLRMRLSFERATLLDRRFGNARNLPTWFKPRFRRIGSNRSRVNRNLFMSAHAQHRRERDSSEQA